MLIRHPAVAGRFYPDGPEDLRQEVRHFLDDGARALPAPRNTTPVGLMLPHAGHVFCGHVIGATLAGMRLPRTLILLCPNHTGMGRPLSVWPDGAWLTPLGPVTVDAALAAALCDGPTVFDADTHAHLREHALEVILPFLQVHQPEPFRIVPICVGTHQRDVLHQAGRDMARLLTGRLLPKPSGVAGGDMPQVAFVVSSDMNHYEDQRRTLQKDDMALRHALACDPDGLLRITQREGISMCGAAPLALVLYALQHLTGKTPPLVEQTLHDTSGSISGDMTHVVGYAGLRIFLP
ncbi:AmmeMemoRadiSam system protein B [uncultured Desulfovibrio sp.]|uniref:AmmeMemoRadiSam system protein B n=1 Tax=uncultured Desulfovibrio sp. TaxID=167968 RepID=UPI002635BBBF|nr:AmmeMemoRadiSam system protein B [uncultured Desulfovibrio sp.]